MATTVRKGSDRPGAKKAIRKTAGGTAAKKTPAKQAAAKKPAAKKPAAKQTTAKKPAAKKSAATKSAATKSVAKRPAARKAPRKAAPKRSARGITPAQALANTRRLLEEKQAHDREAPPWHALEGRHAHEPHGGFQDAQARDRANELHAGESHLEAIQGAASTGDRHNQGKRDQR
jgi:hypothetical protein